MKNNKKLILITILLLSLFLFSLVRISLAQEKDDIDAIGVRIVPNPGNYSISRWYQEQGFQGSPQSLIVDGYEAIRDGRTVYVNATNISGKEVYTNIYIISYNQDPSEKTLDILGQIVSRWKFNSNLEVLENQPEASCSISATSCLDSSDCAQGSYCSVEGPSAGSCRLSKDVNCLIDNDCPASFFCDSLKAKIIRDTKRFGLLAELKIALNNYFRSNGKYPLLSAGTYLSNYSVSLWPSWQNNFLPDIAASPNFIDPINRLGNCPGYDKDTCWSVENSAFVNTPSSEGLRLPAESHALVYSTNKDGSDYNLCAVLESRHPSLEYSFSSTDQKNSNCVTDIGTITSASSTNFAPVLVEYSLSGQVGKEFNGFIIVTDENNDPLEWQLTREGSNWSNWSNDFPKIIDTSYKFQKRVHGSVAGKAGLYKLNLLVNDGRGGILEEKLEVEINDLSVFIEAQNAYHTLDKSKPFNYNIYISGESFTNPANSNNVVVNKISTSSTALPNIFSSPTVKLAGNNRYQLNYNLAIDPKIYQFPQDTEFEFEVVAKDSEGASFKKRFFVNLISEKPVLNFSCPLTIRVGKDYSCFLGKNNYYGNDVFYTSSGLPEVLKLDYKNEGVDVFIAGTTTASMAVSETNTGIHDISITAKSDYGAVSTKGFKLKVNTYCGDGIKQIPNSEGRGGMYNDGQEQCDGADGVATNPKLSGPTNQYGCTTSVGADTPVEIVSRNLCIFKAPLSGGGYCGDGFCQTAFGENKSTCPDDCGYPEEIVDPVLCNKNGICDSGEDYVNCLEDCHCGNGACEASLGENYETCSADCLPVSLNQACESQEECSYGEYCKDLWAYCKDESRDAGSGPGGGDDACTGYGEKSICNENEEIGCWWRVRNPGICTIVETTPIIPDCLSNCIESNKNCGPDGCGGSCGTCSSSETCNNLGRCQIKTCNNNNFCETSFENTTNCPHDCFDATPTPPVTPPSEPVTPTSTPPVTPPSEPVTPTSTPPVVVEPQMCNFNGICEAPRENSNNCPQDCHCGNGICEAGKGETTITCAVDCRECESQEECYYGEICKDLWAYCKDESRDPGSGSGGGDDACIGYGEKSICNENEEIGCWWRVRITGVCMPNN